MRRYLIPLLFLLICSVETTFAKNEQDSLIIKLYKEINNKPFYDNKKRQKINALEQLLNVKNLSVLQEYGINTQLAQEYRKYIIDSAIYYTEKNRELALTVDNMELLAETRLQLSLLYSATGMYIEAKDILNNIDRGSISENLLPLYFEANSQFCGHYAQSNSRHSYFQINEAYRDSLLSVIDPNSTKYKISYAEKILFQNQLEIAEKRLQTLLEKTPEDDTDYGLITYLLGNVYKKKHNVGLQKHYYALSALADIRNSIKDNASMQSLALLAYESEDIDMAYKFTKSAIDDAVFCNVRFRTIEISEFYSIINTAYLAKEKKQKEELQLSLIFISILSLFLIIAVIYVYKQMKRVARIRKELYRTNVKLTELNKDISDSNTLLHKVNTELSESNHVKEEYIAHFFDLCSAYITKLEDYRKALNKKAANNQLDELFKMLKSTTIVDNELEELYKKFDNIFLSLYPTFVEDFNSLLIKEEQVILKPGELLNTELRIFALIRLGITDSVKIAGFLRYSLSTIYNYRTKARNKAAVSRNEFEERVMNIGILQQKR
ncbi:DUF6377 domain-containing protein [Dysgonomonas sp. 511]|uniref:DUF6377 domain-containing protein n=1 Tax=Dysgonomonas sp. 511 TaxID=2302930 RepID=UPI0013D116F6|nr:DUF6377 domain-containing protein [Dysgonomonas sp. 511]NDV78593.1 hypothetical protein [Dysgonomonas sp. 511]